MLLRAWHTGFVLLRPSSVVLVLANLVPLIGVLLFDWRVFDILMLYWVENVVIGLINVMRMIVCRGEMKWFLTPFFVVHYGIFCFGHLAAVTAIFGSSSGTADAWQYFVGNPSGEAWQSPIWIAIAGIALSHLYSFLANFIAAGEYRRTSPRELMQRPYGRIVVLHVTIIIGAALIQWLGSPVGMLAVLIGAKILLDLKLHAAERDRFEPELISS